MRKSGIIITVLLLSALMGCKNFPTVKPSVELEKEFLVNNTTAAFSGQDVLNAGSDSDFEKYKNKINKVDIDRVTYTIVETTGTATSLVSGQLEVSDSKGGGKATLTTLSNVNFASALNKETDIVAGTAALETLRNALSADPFQVNIYYSGTGDKGPIRLRVKLKFYVKITARVIGSN